MHKKRDYIPCRERNFQERYDAGADVANGLSGRVEATQHTPSYRRYRKNGRRDIEAQFPGCPEDFYTFLGDED